MPNPSQSPSEVVHAFLKAMERLAYDEAQPYLDPRCEYTNPPPIGTVRCPEGVRAVLEPFFAPTLENQFLVLREATAGGLVFLERLDRHRLASGWVELPVAGVFEVSDGKIRSWRDYFDAQTLLSHWPAA